LCFSVKHLETQIHYSNAAIQSMKQRALYWILSSSIRCKIIKSL
jgi:hypothetical protein